MKTNLALCTAAALLALALFNIPGCKTVQSRETPLSPRPDSAETQNLTDRHEQKDKTVGKEADNIDNEVKGTKAEAAVTAATAKQREALSNAPSEELKPLFATFNRLLDERDAAIAERDRKIKDQSDQIDALKDAELRAQVRSIRLFGFGALALAAVLGFGLKNLPLAGVAAGIGFLALAVAQAWLRVASHPAFVPSVVVACALSLAGLAWACIHAYKKGDLGKKVEAERDRLKETLKVIVPAIDDAQKTLGDAFKPTLAKLSGGMDWQEKQLVKDIRHEASKEA